MKYFALLTKLGENLLAQATALGTKLELTHMAVGDGGGSLPTPDTNQTKLIKEQRRAAINTLFIDEQNKNQIIAEQIIPEKDGGWWIREIGLFDKAGNLIAVANCPETYKPQLEEGSGRTQSIRMVLIVSHTESVTLKIDPSVVLATREYVNTEITVLDKKIDALSAQTKLDLNKKFDKANISGQKGNDNDKVPSLHLFTTEIGKLAVIGYSYSKIESDGRYQPKGNYAPAGDYATNAALKEGLDGKFDKIGGEIEGPLKIKNARVTVGGVNDFAGIALTRSDESYLLLESRPSGNNALLGIIDRSASGSNKAVVNIPNRSGTVVLEGDFGLGAANDQRHGASGESRFIAYSDDVAARADGYPRLGTGVQIAYRKDRRGVIYIDTSGNVTSRFSLLAGADNTTPFNTHYTTKNTKKDRNGNLRDISSSDMLSDYPVGSPIPWPLPAAPTGFLVCNGQAFNKTTYPLLASAYPSGSLPDLRAEFIRGLDYGRGVDANRTVLSTQGDAIRNITGEAGHSSNQGFLTNDASINGVFTKGAGGKGGLRGDGGGYYNLKFDASNGK
ncbi:phage tail protein [Providencia rettgeri]